MRDRDYYFAPGGVTATVYPMIKALRAARAVSKASWVSLNPNAPSKVVFDDIAFYHVQLPSELIPLYTNFKENIWREFHGLGPTEFSPRGYEAYVYYNWLCAQRMLKLLPDVDLMWVHDFQQLQVGGLIGPSAPTVFRWHIPFRVELVSPRLRDFVTKCLESYDAVIVSTKRDLEGLIHAGYKGRAYQIYPYVDPRKWRPVGEAKVVRVAERHGLSPDDLAVLVVARMDYIKGQDVAIKAHALLRRRRSNVKLLLVGDGSFTSAGLGHSKGETWSRYLRSLVRELGVQDSVKFLGYVGDEELRALYTRADAVVVPSKMEGFGLTTVEAWSYRKPVVVSRGAGSSELVIEGVNGYTFKPEDHEELCEKLDALLSNAEAAAKMGEVGYETSKQCWVSSAVERLIEVFEGVVSSQA